VLDYIVVIHIDIVPAVHAVAVCRNNIGDMKDPTELCAKNVRNKNVRNKT
jgi:hypothetical protein